MGEWWESVGRRAQEGVVSWSWQAINGSVGVFSYGELRISPWRSKKAPVQSPGLTDHSKKGSKIKAAD